MQQQSPEKFQSLLRAIREEDSPMQCPELHPATYICIEMQCQSSIGFCQNSECTCEQSHSLCECIKMSSFSHTLQKMQERQKKFKCLLIKLQQQVLQDLKRKKEQLDQTILFNSLKKQEIEILEAIFFKQKNQNFKRTLVKNLFRKLKHAAVGPEDIESSLLGRFQEELNEFKDKFNEIGEDILRKYSEFRVQIPEQEEANLEIMAEIQRLKRKYKQLQQEKQRTTERNLHLTHELEIASSRCEKLEEECQEARSFNNEIKMKILKTEEQSTFWKVQIEKLKEEHKQADQRNFVDRKQMTEEWMLEREEKEKAIKQAMALRDINKVMQGKLQEVQSQRNPGYRSCIGEKPSKLEEEQSMIKQDSAFSSVIIPLTNTDDIQFLRQALKNPKRLELLYRASQYNFLAERFHQSCDGIENTFTLVKTEFGKVIGGYSPVKWLQPFSGSFIPDPSRQSFLISFSMRQVMALVDVDNALWYGKDWAACFGGDLSLCDKCHENGQSYAQYPTRYSSQRGFSSGILNQDAQIKIAFCGSPNGYFKVSEYEVFKVIW